MGYLRRLWHGADAAVPTTDLHESTLESIIVADALQNGSAVERLWRIPAAYRGAQILSDLAGQLPLYAYAGGPNSGQRRVEDAEQLELTPTVLLRPDPFITRGEWLRAAVLSLVVDGNLYLEKSGYADGLPTVVRVLTPSRMSVTSNTAQTRPVYTYKGRAIAAERLDHLALNRGPGQLKGVGPLKAAQDTIQGQLNADAFARELFGSGGIPSGKLMSAAKLTGPEAKSLLEAWETGQAEGRKTAVLAGGIDYDPISLSPDDGQLLQSRGWGVQEIARVLGIPAHLLQASIGVAGGSGSSLTYTNVQSIFSEIVRMTILPVYLSRIEEAASGWLPRGQSAIFDHSLFTRADDRTRWDGYKIALDAGFLTIDEVRAREGLAPDPDLVPSPADGTEVGPAERSTAPQPDDDEVPADA